MNSLINEIIDILDAEGISSIDYNSLSSNFLIGNFGSFKELENQQKLVALIGLSKDIRFFEFLEYCIFNAKNDNLRHGSLKYVHNFKHQINLNSIFSKIELNNQQKAYEPYFSIAKDMSSIKIK